MFKILVVEDDKDLNRTARHIADAAKRIVAGDFSARVERPSRFSNDESFFEIIDCFNRMAKELSGVETLRTDFISNVSHEMKTPLAAMQNYGTLLQRQNLPEEKRMEYARGITENSRRLADMVTNILKLNKLENQQIFPHAEKFDLGEQLCECLLQYESVWEKEQIDIETDIADDVQLRVNLSLYSAFGLNAMYAVFQFFLGLRHHSAWFYAMSGYYLLLTLMRLTLENAMLTTFGQEDSELFRQIILGLSGMAVICIVLAIALYMIHHANKELKRNHS